MSLSTFHFRLVKCSTLKRHWSEWHFFVLNHLELLAPVVHMQEIFLDTWQASYGHPIYETAVSLRPLQKVREYRWNILSISVWAHCQHPGLQLHWRLMSHYDSWRVWLTILHDSPSKKLICVGNRETPSRHSIAWLFFFLVSSRSYGLQMFSCPWEKIPHRPQGSILGLCL